VSGVSPVSCISRSGNSSLLSLTAEHKREWLPWAVFGIFLGFEVCAHYPLLRLPYFWDEAGYYVPAARDLLRTGTLIPQSAPSNAHPPLVMAYLAGCWKVAGASPFVTRTAMLAVSAFALLGLFRLASRVANRQVAWATALCTALYPVFFAQSSMAHVDLAAAAFTFWALDAFLADKTIATAIWFSLSVLAKETAILAPVALLVWVILCPAISGRFQESICRQKVRPSMLAALITPVLVLASWYGYHFAETGYVFGNPEFFRYNVQATVSPLRIVLALGMRVWQAFGYLHLFVLTLFAAWAMTASPFRDEGIERPRIAVATQCLFGAVILAYVTAMAVVGGAVLARYMLPVVPLVILVCVSTLWRRSRWWGALVIGVSVAFIAGLFMNPPYGFAPEDNLAYADYIRMHEAAARYLQAHPPRTGVLTAWPASDELTRLYLGYVTRPFKVVRIEDFSPEQIQVATQVESQYDAALLFSTKYEPEHPLLTGWNWWQNVKHRYFGYHKDVAPEFAAQALGGRIVFHEHRGAQWVAIITLAHDEDARDSRAHSGSHEMAGMSLHHEPYVASGN
jgi:4-amino-4-deoxy-L-arabinose transferase-like glycosyltransferase